MQLSGTERFEQGPQLLWDRLTDLTRFATILPKLERIDRSEPRLLECRVKPGLSFLSGTLKLRMEILEEDPISSARMKITGKGIGASVVVETSIRLTADTIGGTQLDWASEVQEIGGLLKPVSRGLIEAAAEKVIADGWEAFRRDLENERA
ncbi:MAG: CoxG family protein [Planctomycetaceae bacterium]